MDISRIFHTLCVISAVIFTGASASAEGLTPTGVFANLPLDVIDMLRPAARLDMIDYYAEADSLAPVQDALGGSSRLEAVAPDYLRAAITPVSTLEIKLLPLAADTIVMTLYTVKGDGIAADSKVDFFDRDLKPLQAGKFLKLPEARNFFRLKGSDISARKLDELLPFSSIALSTGPGDTPLSAEFTSVGTLPDEEASMLTPLLQNLEFLWTGKSYKLRR
ncbi:MAG: DUF3256 family protein [Muribaculaceae bacterium]|nr:DUF3256 family protein [Muribaculaceae bacterium]